MTTEDPAPIPMLLWCPGCGERHVDVGPFATKRHHTHACQDCGMVWRPAIVPTVGVRFLPGYKNEEPHAASPLPARARAWVARYLSKPRPDATLEASMFVAFVAGAGSEIPRGEAFRERLASLVGSIARCDRPCPQCRSLASACGEILRTETREPEEPPR